MTSLFVAIAAGVLGLVTFDGRVSPSDLPLSAFLLVLGIFGAVVSAKHYECFSMHQRRASKYREALEATSEGAGILALRLDADKENNLRFPRLHKLRLNQLWVGIHLVIGVVGAVIMLGIFLGWYP